MSDAFIESSDAAIDVETVNSEWFDEWRTAQQPLAASWIERTGFAARVNQFCWLPTERGEPDRVAVGVSGEPGIATLGGLPSTLPEGDYRLVDDQPDLALLGWALGAYRFTRFRDADRAPARLVVPDTAQRERVSRLAGAVSLARDLINRPAGDLGPTQLAAAVAELGALRGAAFSEIVGDDLLADNLNTIHAVGRAADDGPRLAELNWGDAAHPRVTVIGKGVVFDSGGLDIKPANGMRLMKKDMGGAAQALALADLIMTNGLPVRLRVLIPIVENAISGNALRPGDVVRSRHGLTVEIDNTDAEGRLILCDALSLAVDDDPELIVDFATLTGAARSALGTDLPAMFCNRDDVADGILKSGQANDDPVWRMPLFAGYEHMLKSSIADTVNSASGPYAGAITAALFLQKFVDGVPWVHFDLMAFNLRTRPGRPEGGEAMAMRAVFHYLEARYATA